MERRIIKGLLIGMVIISSCYYDNAEELYPPTNCVTDNMSLQANIEPILDRNCYVCHSTVAGPSNGNVILEEYEELVKYANDGKLVNSIKYESDFPMPKGAPKLGDCDIAKIESWVNAGAPNN